ncbi:ClcB-like voltage-gated chloride channel protein [Pollutimonas harenae]|uniref:ClcB-like voltage-gated chloride channel protein n=1 Tax=Pollutimonas harenae TaxID=657015 RepID=A0A853GX61_9BURK|nr:ClcB-like voltage-gated chloride channel protein [Pollutimonas harenae]NYT85336.1 ClcB-like voltage-gated chloride channel protein [Pollutimonas harenae]TEA70438.1 voltage-gated chloride channel ClcB [Pollutimonas harenae]
MIRSSVQSVRERLAGYSWLSDLPAMLCWAALVGALGAFATIAFHEGMRLVQELATGRSGSIVGVTRELPWYGRLLFPMLGGVVAGALLWASKQLKESTNSDYMEAVAIGDGRLSLRQGLLRSLSSLSSVASGGSIGREGAMVHLASLSASLIGRFTRFSTARLRLLVACGAAAGVASAYGTPIAGALFVAEIVLGTMGMQSLGPLLVAAASANIVMRLSGHYHTTYAIIDMPQIPGLEVLPFLLLGVFSGLGAPLFLKFLDFSRRQFRRTELPLPARLGLGGGLLGILLIIMPEVAGNGYSVVHSLLHASWTWYAVLTILLFKVLATAFTVGSGAVGGVFTPALFVGGGLGALFGMVVSWLWPGMTAETYMYVLVGMGSFLGAATSAPLMAILMIFEMTLSYQIVLPLMLACVIAHFVSRAVAEVAMYDVTVVRERDAWFRYRLRHTVIQDLVRPADTVVATTAPVRDALQMFLEYPVKYLYVVDEKNTYQGVIAQQDLTSLLLGQGDVQSKLAGEVLRLDFVKTLHPDMTLDQAQEYFVHFQGERLPVVSRGDQPTLLGVVYKSSLLEKYSALKRSFDTSGEAMLDFPAGRRLR